jgi:hypothetical protein
MRQCPVPDEALSAQMTLGRPARRAANFVTAASLAIENRREQ